MTKQDQRILVRIAVAVDMDGNWSAAGNCAYESSDDATRAALDYLPVESSPVRHIVWVDAEVPLPTRESVHGVVTAVTKS